MRSSAKSFASSVNSAISIRSDDGSHQSTTELFAARAERALREGSLSPVPSSRGFRHAPAAAVFSSSEDGLGGGLLGSSRGGILSDVPFVGRDEELSAIGSVIDALIRRNNNNNNSNHPPEIPRVVTIVGEAGRGKSRLASELRTQVLERDGYFARGKCECQMLCPPAQLQANPVQHNSNNTAYAGLANALKDLTDQIMARDFDMGIRRRLREAIPPQDALVLTEIFPSLENILETDHVAGSGGDVSLSKPTLKRQETSGDQRARRRRVLFQKFMRVLLLSSIDYCDEDINTELEEQNPQNEEAAALVLVMDDVQWIDLPSLDLLSGLVQDPELTNFLLVATLRPLQQPPICEGIVDTRPFVHETRLWQEQNILLQNHHIQNLDVASINTIVASVLDTTDREWTLELAEIIHQKTQGNAFFALEFLQALIDQNLLTYSYGTLNWKWDPTKVQSLVWNETDGAVGLVLTKMNRRLPAHSQFVMVVAACLGGALEKQLLMSLLLHVRGQDIVEGWKDDQPLRENEVESTLASLVEWTLLARHQDLYFISHDLIREAAMDLVPPDKIALLKVRMGEHILRHLLVASSPTGTTCGGGGGGGGSLLFLGVGLCNSDCGGATTLDPALLAEYNLLAGEKALQESAFACALQYMEKGISLLEGTGQVIEPGSPQNDHYERLLAGLVEAEYCVGKTENVSASAEKVLRRKCSTSLELQMLYFKILSANSKEDYEEAIDYGLAAMKLLNMAPFPRKPSMFHVAKELVKTQRRMRYQTKDTLLALPPLSDQNRVNAQKFFDILQDASFICNPTFFFVSQLKSVRWAVKYGVSEYTPAAFVLYGSILQNFFSDTKRCTMFGEAALELADLLGSKHTIAKATMMTFGVIHHWTNDIRACHPPLLYASKVFMECGDIVGGLTACWYMDAHSWICARVTLQGLAQELERHYASCRAYKNTSVGDALVFMGTNVRKLCDANDKEFKWLDAIECGYAKREKEQQRGAASEAYRNTISLETHFLLGEMTEALECTKKLHDVAKISMGLATVTRAQYYRGLVLLFFAGQGQDAKSNIREAKRIIAMMKKWISNGNINCVHMVWLLEAELERVKKQRDSAKKLYGDAIRMATRTQFTHDVGICNQCAANFFLEIKDASRAAFYFKHAISGFSAWGATELARRLREMHWDLLSDSKLAGYQSAAFTLPDQ